MFSWHKDQRNIGDGKRYHQGFETADVSLERMAKCIVNYAWSPIVWGGGKRAERAFLQADWCALDFDSGEMTLEEAKEVWCDMVHIIGTTKSHQVNGVDRFRVVLKLESPIIRLDHYKYFMRQMLSRVLEADKACLDGARFFWPCKEIVSLANDGYLEEVSPIPVEEIEKQRARQAFQLGFIEAGVLNPWATGQLRAVIPVGQRTVTCYRVAKDLLLIGKSSDETLKIILNSKTYNGDTSAEVYKKIFQAVLSAERAVLRMKE